MLNDAEVCRINVIKGHRKRKGLCEYCGLDRDPVCNNGSCGNDVDFTKTDMRITIMSDTEVPKVYTDQSKRIIKSHRRKKGICERCGLNPTPDCIANLCTEVWTKSDMRETIIEKPTLVSAVSELDTTRVKPDWLADVKVAQDISIHNEIEKQVSEEYIEAPIVKSKTFNDPIKINNQDKPFIFLDMRESDNGFRIKLSFIQLLHGHMPDLMLIMNCRAEESFKFHEMLRIKKIPNIRFVGNLNEQSILNYAVSSIMYISFPNDISCLSSKYNFKSFTFTDGSNITNTSSARVNLMNQIRHF